jgi:hypothetical protein
MDRSVLVVQECVKLYRIVLSWTGVFYVVQESVKLDRSVLSWIRVCCIGQEELLSWTAVC